MSMGMQDTGDARLFHENPITVLLGGVHEGMVVVDATGKTIGQVDAVKMGDPEAVTTAGNEPSVGAGSAGPDPLGGMFVGPPPFGDGRGEPDVPDPLRSELLRVGYLKLTGHGLNRMHRYVAADRVAGVSADTVTLLPEGQHAAAEPIASTPPPATRTLGPTPPRTPSTAPVGATTTSASGVRVEGRAVPLGEVVRVGSTGTPGTPGASSPAGATSAPGNSDRANAGDGPGRGRRLGVGLAALASGGMLAGGGWWGYAAYRRRRRQTRFARLVPRVVREAVPGAVTALGQQARGRPAAAGLLLLASLLVARRGRNGQVEVNMGKLVGQDVSGARQVHLEAESRPLVAGRFDRGLPVSGRAAVDAAEDAMQKSTGSNESARHRWPGRALSPLSARPPAAAWMDAPHGAGPLTEQLSWPRRSLGMWWVPALGPVVYLVWRSFRRRGDADAHTPPFAAGQSPTSTTGTGDFAPAAPPPPASAPYVDVTPAAAPTAARGDVGRATAVPGILGTVTRGETDRRVVEEERTIHVPMMREEVVVERHPVERHQVDEAVLDQGIEVMRIPVREERVTVEAVPKRSSAAIDAPGSGGAGTPAADGDRHSQLERPDSSPDAGV